MKPMRSSLLSWAAGCMACVNLCSCGGEVGPNIEMLPTYPISGEVTVDGAPAQGVMVKCETVGASSPGVVTPTISGFTDDKGHFSIGTYTASDGAPEGQYALTFQWGEFDLFSRSYAGDKLNKRYSDPAKSQFKVTVEKGKTNDMGVIALKTKD